MSLKASAVLLKLELALEAATTIGIYSVTTPSRVNFFGLVTDFDEELLAKDWLEPGQSPGFEWLLFEANGS